MAQPPSDLAGEEHLQILPPAIRDDDIADVQSGVHAAGDAGEHDALDGEVVQRKLHRHRRVDDADPAQEEDDLAPLQGAGGEGDAVHREHRRALRLPLKDRQLRREGGDDGDARSLVPNGVRVRRRGRDGCQQQRGRESGDQGPYRCVV